MAPAHGRLTSDERFMHAAIRLSRRHLGLTATNPSVATLIVREGIIIGRGVTALGGRPHAEAEALAEAGPLARGATAYVTLEPCAHHGRTPPCAQSLAAAGLARVVGGASDPDPRVSGKGYAILRRAGVAVTEGVLADAAASVMAGYLTRSVKKRTEVILKMAVSADGKMGLKGRGQVTITGEVARRQVHLMRAEADAILVGIDTAISDDPELTCRLPGLERRSPTRIVLDRLARLPTSSKLVLSATAVPVVVATTLAADPGRRAALEQAGVRIVAADSYEDRIALPELLEDLAASGMSSLIVEGGARTASGFLADGLVDRIALFTGPGALGDGGIPAPLTRHAVPPRFRLGRSARFGVDLYEEWVRAV